MEDIKSGRVIKGSNLDKTIISFIHDNWPNSKSGFFPGPQPISIERKHFKTLFKGDHLVCEKTDGVRHLFVAFLYKGAKKLSFLVNRSYDITVVPNVFAVPLILDGCNSTLVIAPVGDTLVTAAAAPIPIAIGCVSANISSSPI
jgi:hypothetical protein